MRGGGGGGGGGLEVAVVQEDLEQIINSYDSGGGFSVSAQTYPITVGGGGWWRRFISGSKGSNGSQFSIQYNHINRWRWWRKLVPNSGCGQGVDGGSGGGGSGGIMGASNGGSGMPVSHLKVMMVVKGCKVLVVRWRRRSNKAVAVASGGVETVAQVQQLNNSRFTVMQVAVVQEFHQTVTQDSSVRRRWRRRRWSHGQNYSSSGSGTGAGRWHS